MRLRRTLILLALASGLFANGAAAGGGFIDVDGNAHLSLNFSYPPTDDEINQLKAELQIASRILCDASDGAMRLGSVSITASTANSMSHDIVVLNSDDGRSRASLLGLGAAGIGNIDGSRVSMDYTDLQSKTLAHELGHYLFALGDEYPENERWDTNCGIGAGVDGTNGEIIDAVAGTEGHTVMGSSFGGGACGVVDGSVPGGIQYTGGVCNFDELLDAAALGIDPAVAPVRSCAAGEVCFTRTFSELTIPLNHDRVNGFNDGADCPAASATTSMSIGGILDQGATHPDFDPSTFATAKATSGAQHDFEIIGVDDQRHTLSLFFEHRTDDGPDAWTVHIGAKSAELDTCPNTATGDLCIVDSIAFTVTPLVPGCGNMQTEYALDEQCDTGIPASGDVFSQCEAYFPFTTGELFCNDVCAIDASNCLAPLLWTCGNFLFPGRQDPEQCDGADLGGADCESLGFGPGTLGCHANCTFDTSGCTPRELGVAATFALEGGRSLPIDLDFDFGFGAMTISLTSFTPAAGDEFSIRSSEPVGTYINDTSGYGKASCANERYSSLQQCIDGYSGDTPAGTTMRFETSSHSHYYKKNCAGQWLLMNEACSSDSDCNEADGETCVTVNASCVEGGAVASSCQRCAQPSPFSDAGERAAYQCPDCGSNPNTICGVSEREVLLKVMQDLNAVGNRALSFDVPPTAPDSVASSGWDEPPMDCLTSQVTVTSNVDTPDQVYLIIDMSGSMGEPKDLGSFESKLNYAKAAARRYLEIRKFSDFPLGLSYFDHEVNPTLDGIDPAPVQVPIAAANSGTPSTATQIDASIDALIPRGNTAIGQALIEAVAAFEAAGDAASRRIYIFTDGRNNVAPAPTDQSVLDELARLDIHVDVATIGSNVDDIALRDIAQLSGGSMNAMPEADYMPDTLEGFGMSERSASHALRPTESLVYDPEQFAAASCTRETCISPLINAPLSESETHEIPVEVGAQRLEVTLVSRQNFSGFWEPDFQLVSPDGSLVIGPDDTTHVTHDDGSSTCVEVDSCTYWSLIDVPAPADGVWELHVATKDDPRFDASRVFQASFVSAIVDNPAVECHAGVLDTVIADGETARIVASASFGYQKIAPETMSFSGSVRGPDGVEIPLSFAPHPVDPEDVIAEFDAFVGRGSYDVTVRCDVPETAELLPGETGDGSSQPVPAFSRTVVRDFFLDSTTMPPGILPDDCDYDGIPDSVEGEGDTDGDGWTDACDPDADDDQIGDLIERDTDTDGDGDPDYVDDDSDDDGVSDAWDNCRILSNPDQGNIDGDFLGDACDPDMDGDGDYNAFDNCPMTPNPDQEDTDGDGVGDACEGGTGCTPVIDAPDASLERCMSEAFATELDASATCGPNAVPVWGRVVAVNGTAFVDSAPFGPADAPALPEGTVVIEWSATGSGGITTTETQTLNIGQADTPQACCPAGSIVIEGSFLPDLQIQMAIAPYCILTYGGWDLVTTGLGDDVISGGDFSDELVAGGPGDLVLGGGGADQITLSLGGTAFGGDGSDSLFVVLGESTLDGGDGADAILGGPFADDITPGAGADAVNANAGDDIVRINATCEVEAGETLDGGLGFDTLYTPVPLSELLALGVNVVSFEYIVETGGADAYKAACAQVPCVPQACPAAPACGAQLSTICPGVVQDCPCSGGDTCEDGSGNAVPNGVVGQCVPSCEQWTAANWQHEAANRAYEDTVDCGFFCWDDRYFAVGSGDDLGTNTYTTTTVHSTVDGYYEAGECP